MAQRWGKASEKALKRRGAKATYGAGEVSPSPEQVESFVTYRDNILYLAKGSVKPLPPGGKSCGFGLILARNNLIRTYVIEWPVQRSFLTFCLLAATPFCRRWMR